MKKWVPLIFLFLLSIFVYTRGLGLHGVEYRDDEIFYYRATQEMLAQGNYLSPTYFGEDRFQKPILFYWLVMLFYQILGLNWFAARLVAVLFAAGSVCLTWMIARDLFSRRVANLSVLILMTIPLFFRHAKNVVPDMALNFFTVLAMWAALRFIKNSEQKKWSYLFFVACALGFMIKGFAPMIAAFLTLIIDALIRRDFTVVKKINFGRGLALMAALILPWFIYMIYTHGAAYFQYMWVEETQHRLLNTAAVNPLFKILRSFGHNTLFYLEVLRDYFAPWWVFLLMALPLVISRIRVRCEHQQALRWMMIWFFVVFIFFSFVHVTISHYLLILSTPFAILLAYSFIEILSQPTWVSAVTRSGLTFFLILSFVGWAFFHIFIVGATAAWLTLYFVLVIGLVAFLWRTPQPVMAPAILAVFLLLVMSQSPMMVKAGVAAHSTLQRFAQTINQDSEAYIIGVGSHDIHEKEFQVFFDQKVEKAGHSYRDLALQNIRNLFSSSTEVYCLITEKDYEQFGPELSAYPLDVVQQEYMFRKRLRLDQGFLTAVLHLDQQKVHEYLMEKIILLRKAPHV